MSERPTIVAVATPPASGGVGILRVSGAEALAVTLPFVRGVPTPPAPRHAYLTQFVDEASELLDEGLFLYFQAPHSYTGEDVVELQTHGSPRLLRLLEERLVDTGRVRLAEPGEFTRRAFLNGRLDLARAEAVAELIAAESEAQVRAAARQLKGEFGDRVRTLRSPLLELCAECEGMLDFPDEADDAGDGLGERVDALRDAVRALADEVARGRVIRRGARVVLFGPVNAGKSTLFNRLLGEARALVDEEPGTTRDLLEARLELEGLAVTLVDSAGLRPEATAGRVEALGIEKTLLALREADLALLLAPWGTSTGELRGWIEKAGATPLLVVLAKCDLLAPTDALPAAPHPTDPEGAPSPGLPAARPEAPVSPSSERAASRSEAPVSPSSERAASRPEAPVSPSSERAAPPQPRAGGTPPLPASPLRVSGLTGEGVDELRGAVSRALAGDSSRAVLAVSARSAEALRRAADATDKAALALRVSTLEVVAQELRLALDALFEVTGEQASTELLDAVFRRFCVGK